MMQSAILDQLMVEAMKSDDSPAWVMETCRLLANSQALLLANLAHGLAQALGADLEDVAAAMEALDMHHPDERIECSQQACDGRCLRRCARKHPSLTSTMRRALSSSRGTPKGAVRASPEDIHITARIRTKRLELQLPMAYLAQPLGVSIQQVINYETGARRVSAGRLFHIAVALRTPVEWFYEGLPVLTSEPLTPLVERKRWQRALRTPVS